MDNNEKWNLGIWDINPQRTQNQVVMLSVRIDRALMVIGDREISHICGINRTLFIDLKDLVETRE